MELWRFDLDYWGKTYGLVNTRTPCQCKVEQLVQRLQNKCVHSDIYIALSSFSSSEKYWQWPFNVYNKQSQPSSCLISINQWIYVYSLTGSQDYIGQTNNRHACGRLLASPIGRLFNRNFLILSPYYAISKDLNFLGIVSW